MHMHADDFFAANPPGLRDALAPRTVLVCGCGGLGSNAAMLLARAGIGGLILIDFDCVSASNLNRQFFFADQIGHRKTEALRANLLRIRPDLHCTCINARIDLPFLRTFDFSHIDFILECFDVPESKAALLNFALTALPECPGAAVSGLAGCGPLGAVTRETRVQNWRIFGDGTTDVAHGDGTFSARVMTAAACETQAVIEAIYDSTP